jgi:hypothetical protein
MSANRDRKRDGFETRAKLKSPGIYVSGKNWLDHSEACARVDQMLLAGADMAKLLTSGRKLSAVRSHLSHLQSEHGLTVSDTGGVYRFAYPDSRTSKAGAERPAAAAPVRPLAVAEARYAEPPWPAKSDGSQPQLVPRSAMTGTSSGVVAPLFAEAERLIRAEVARNRSDDLKRQFEIIESRRFHRVTDEPGILNNLIIQASSYSVVRKYFGALYPDEIWKFDREFGTHFFEVGKAPRYAYAAWERIVLAWGNGLLAQQGESAVSDLAALVQGLRRARDTDWASYSKQARSRIILSLATALPKVRREVLANPTAFLDRLDGLSRRHPGRAYEAADRFAEGILQMGNPLVCNFFKELGLLYYVKVDVHVGDFIDELALKRDLGPKQQFILSWLMAREAGMPPFFLDKILYVGGKYCKPTLKALFQSRRSAYEREVNRLIDEIPALS